MKTHIKTLVLLLISIIICGCASIPVPLDPLSSYGDHSSKPENLLWAGDSEVIKTVATYHILINEVISDINSDYYPNYAKAYRIDATWKVGIGLIGVVTEAVTVFVAQSEPETASYIAAGTGAAVGLYYAGSEVFSSAGISPETNQNKFKIRYAAITSIKSIYEEYIESSKGLRSVNPEEYIAAVELLNEINNALDSKTYYQADVLNSLESAVPE